MDTSTFDARVTEIWAEYDIGDLFRDFNDSRVGESAELFDETGQPFAQIYRRHSYATGLTESLSPDDASSGKIPSGIRTDGTSQPRNLDTDSILAEDSMIERGPPATSASANTNRSTAVSPEPETKREAALNPIIPRNGLRPTRRSTRLAQQRAGKASSDGGRAVRASITVSSYREMARGPVMKSQRTTRSMIATSASTRKTSDNSVKTKTARTPRSLSSSKTSMKQRPKRFRGKQVHVELNIERVANQDPSLSWITIDGKPVLELLQEADDFWEKFRESSDLFAGYTAQRFRVVKLLLELANAHGVMQDRLKIPYLALVTTRQTATMRLTLKRRLVQLLMRKLVEKPEEGKSDPDDPISAAAEIDQHWATWNMIQGETPWVQPKVRKDMRGRAFRAPRCIFNIGQLSVQLHSW